MHTRNNGLYKIGFYKKLHSIPIEKAIANAKSINRSLTKRSLNKKRINIIKSEINYLILKQLTPKRKVYPLIKIKIKISKNEGSILKQQYDITGRFTENFIFENEYI